MASTFTDPPALALDGRLSKPRGLLSVPPEIHEIVAKEEARIAREHGICLTSEAKQRLRDSLTLQYYYENHTLAYRQTSQGVEVLAVGDQEIGNLVRALSQEERLRIKIGQI